MGRRRSALRWVLFGCGVEWLVVGHTRRALTSCPVAGQGTSCCLSVHKMAADYTAADANCAVRACPDDRLRDERRW
eukprot:2854430-Rhodomonas_salina.1